MVKKKKHPERKNIEVKELRDDYNYLYLENCKISYAEMDDDKRKDICGEIVAKNTEIETQWDPFWSKAEDIETKYYKGDLPTTRYPYPGCPNVNMPLIRIQVDGGRIRAKKVLLEAEPLWICEPTEDGFDEKLLRDKEDALDYKARTDTKFVPEMEFVIYDCYLKGLGVMKMPYHLHVERCMDIEIYEFGEVERFDRVYGDLNEYEDNKKAELISHRKAIENLKEAGTKHVMRIMEDKDVINGPDPRRVDLKNYRIDINTKSTEQDLAGFEGEITEMSMDEIKRFADRKIYEQKAYDKIMENHQHKEPEEVAKQKPHKIWEGIYSRDINNDGFVEKCFYTIDLTENVMLRALYYHYRHNKSYFIPHYIDKRADKYYGWGLGFTLESANETENRLMNTNLQAAEIANIPTFKRRRQSKFNPYQNHWFPGVIFDVDKMDDIDQMTTSGRGQAENRILQEYNTRNAEMLGGISSLMSGRETPSDPKAPGIKVNALLYEAGVKASYYIENISEGMSESGRQLDELLYQYMGDEISYRVRHKGSFKFNKITKQEWKQAVNLRPRGQSEYANKQIRSQIDMAAYTMLIENPLIAQNPFAVYEITKIAIMSIGGQWDKRVDKILPDEEAFKQQMVEVQKEALKQMEAEKDEMQQQQIIEEEIVRKIRETGGGEKEATKAIEEYRKQVGQDKDGNKVEKKGEGK